jgi:hypothetical protein
MFLCVWFSWFPIVLDASAFLGLKFDKILTSKIKKTILSVIPFFYIKKPKFRNKKNLKLLDSIWSLIDSPKYRQKLKFSYFRYFYSQIWWYPLMYDRHFTYITKLEDRHFTYITKLEEKTSVTHISNHREN